MLGYSARSYVFSIRYSRERLKLDNIKLADEWLGYIGTIYEEYKERFRASAHKEHREFDEDVYSDTISKCYDSIVRNGLKDTTEQGMRNYLFRAFKQNLKRENQYCRVTKRDTYDDTIADSFEYESSDELAYRQHLNDFKVMYILKLVEQEFDPISYYCFRLKWLLPKMTYEKLQYTTRIKDCKKRVVEVKNWLIENVDLRHIEETFEKLYV